MASTGLKNFIDKLQNAGELKRITSYFNPLLEITEVTDRISKSGGPALLFENNGTIFPLLINTFGSDKRIAMARKRDRKTFWQTDWYSGIIWSQIIRDTTAYKNIRNYAFSIGEKRKVQGSYS
jgi:UbiD family decarboxylase